MWPAPLHMATVWFNRWKLWIQTWWLFQVVFSRHFGQKKFSCRPGMKIFFRPKCRQNITRKSHQVWIHYFHWLNHTVVIFSGAGHIDPPPVVVGWSPKLVYLLRRTQNSETQKSEYDVYLSNDKHFNHIWGKGRIRIYEFAKIWIQIRNTEARPKYTRFL